MRKLIIILGLLAFSLPLFAQHDVTVATEDFSLSSCGGTNGGTIGSGGTACTTNWKSQGNYRCKQLSGGGSAIGASAGSGCWDNYIGASFSSLGQFVSATTNNGNMVSQPLSGSTAVGYSGFTGINSCATAYPCAYWFGCSKSYCAIWKQYGAGFTGYLASPVSVSVTNGSTLELRLQSNGTTVTIYPLINGSTPAGMSASYVDDGTLVINSVTVGVYKNNTGTPAFYIIANNTTNCGTGLVNCTISNWAGGNFVGNQLSTSISDSSPNATTYSNAFQSNVGQYLWPSPLTPIYMQSSYDGNYRWCGPPTIESGYHAGTVGIGAGQLVQPNDYCAGVGPTITGSHGPSGEVAFEQLSGEDQYIQASTLFATADPYFWNAGLSLKINPSVIPGEGTSATAFDFAAYYFMSEPENNGSGVSQCYLSNKPETCTGKYHISKVTPQASASNNAVVPVCNSTIDPAVGDIQRFETRRDANGNQWLLGFVNGTLVCSVMDNDLKATNGYTGYPGLFLGQWQSSPASYPTYPVYNTVSAGTLGDYIMTNIPIIGGVSIRHWSSVQ